ncbi:MAG: type II toxin-antitoxin system Phd/YefM family antitoxin [Cycloclasticus sp.]|nr:type II toxin-antitoxin system Phd/YefM family antitoxin [Cycloclasticus sp.]
METFTSTDVKNKVGPFMDEARKSPVLITKNGRPSIIALPVEDYEKMELEALRNKLAHSEAQADRGEYVESSLNSMLKRLEKKRELKNG